MILPRILRLTTLRKSASNIALIAHIILINIVGDNNKYINIRFFKINKLFNSNNIHIIYNNIGQIVKNVSFMFMHHFDDVIKIFESKFINEIQDSRSPRYEQSVLIQNSEHINLVE